MEIRILGPVEILVAGSRVEIGPPQRRAVFAALAADAGRPVPVSTLIDRVWGESTPAHVRAAVHSNITLIRRVLAEVKVIAADGPPATLARQGGGYLLRVDAQQVDLHRFGSLAAAARDIQCPDAERARLLRQALDLWQGPALLDLSGGWPERMRDSWGQQRLDAAVDWARAELQLGHHEQVISPIRALLAEYPLAEPLVAALMRALYVAGRAAEALDCYAITRARLADELGADPSAELHDLHRAILRGDRPDPAPATTAGAPTPKRAAPAVGLPVPRELPADVSGFTGREDALKTLDEMLPGNGNNTTGPVVISAIAGTAGVGKTALAVHWAHRVRHRFPDGQLYVNLRGFDPSGTVAVPAEVIRQFLDALAVPAHRIPADPAAQVSLFRTLLADKRILVVLDNARDPEQVQPLLPGAPGCLVLITSRNRLTGLVAAAGAHALFLDLLTIDEARDLLSRRLGPARIAAEPDTVHALIAGCARLPLALAIVAATAATHPQMSLAALAGHLRDSRNRLDALSTRDSSATDVRAAFSWSYQVLRKESARLFRLLGLQPGPDISTAAAASLTGLPTGQVWTLLNELADAHLITEHSPGRYSFHDLLRGYAADLARTTESDEERRAASGRVLDHYLHTGYAAARLLDPAQEPLALATARPGVVQEELVGHKQALDWFTAEQALLLAAVDHAATTGFDTHTWQLAWTLRNFLDRQGQWHRWAAVQHAAVAAASRVANPTIQATAHRYLANAYTRLQRFEDAHTHLRRALALTTQTGDLSGQARIHQNLAHVWERQGGHSEALNHTRQSLALYKAAGDQRGQARCLNGLGWYHALLGDYEHALTACQQALPLVQELDDRQAQAATWDSLGYAHHHLGHYDQAITCYQHALDLVQNLGDRYYVALAHSHLGDTHHAANNPDAARRAWQQALTILDQLDHPSADEVRAKLQS